MILDNLIRLLIFFNRIDLYRNITIESYLYLNLVQKSRFFHYSPFMRGEKHDQPLTGIGPSQIIH